AEGGQRPRGATACAQAPRWCARHGRRRGRSARSRQQPGPL
ncbi:MAG: hypothetical protein AVDCRST_MAG08-4325, partial [uncultured Acetobacteraceae bacterium]